jgi:hypothetical protein
MPGRCRDEAQRWHLRVPTLTATMRGSRVHDTTAMCNAERKDLPGHDRSSPKVEDAQAVAQGGRPSRKEMEAKRPAQGLGWSERCVVVRAARPPASSQP